MLITYIIVQGMSTVNALGTSMQSHIEHTFIRIFVVTVFFFIYFIQRCVTMTRATIRA